MSDEAISTVCSTIFFLVFFGMLMMLNAKEKEIDAGKYVACLSAQEKVAIDLKCGGKK